MRRVRLAVLVPFLFGALPATAAAQSYGPEFSVGLGPTVPSGRFADQNLTGYNVTLGLGGEPEGWPVGVRVEGIYNGFTLASGVYACDGSTCGRTSSVAGGTLNLVYDRLLPRRRTERRRGRPASTLFVIGGLGLYQVHAIAGTIITPAGPGYASATQSYAGWNLGGGIRFPVGGISAYVEARVHALETGTRFVPVTVGLIF